MVEANDRGSAKLEAMTIEDLHKSIGLARTSYKIERWWKYGQPRIDRITATVNVTDVKVAGKLIEGLIGQHGPQHQIDVVVFPYGIPVLDGVRFNVNMSPSAH